MMYVVQEHEGNLYAKSYDGVYVGKDDEKYLAKLAGLLSYDSISLNGEKLKATKAKKTFAFKGLLEVVPYVFIKGDVQEDKAFQVPFINDKIFRSFLVCVDNLPGLQIPENFEQYVTAEKPEAGIEVKHPIGLYNNEKISTFPFDLPVPYSGDDVIYAYGMGLLELYPLYEEVATKFSEFLKKKDIKRFITLDIIAEKLGIPFYAIEANKVVAFMLPNMEEVEPGVFIIGKEYDPRGVGIDTNKGEILTCWK